MAVPDVVTESIGKTALHKFNFSSIIINITENIRIFVSLKLPMIVEPKDYSYYTDENGKRVQVLVGYLMMLIRITVCLYVRVLTKHLEKEDSDEIYTMINSLSKVDYKINKVLLV